MNHNSSIDLYICGMGRSFGSLEFCRRGVAWRSTPVVSWQWHADGSTCVCHAVHRARTRTRRHAPLALVASSTLYNMPQT